MVMVLKNSLKSIVLSFKSYSQRIFEAFLKLSERQKPENLCHFYSSLVLSLKTMNRIQIRLPVDKYLQIQMRELWKCVDANNLVKLKKHLSSKDMKKAVYSRDR